jgi:glyoxylase-like metal-dependent hydrolase (beta-lactamase superfamily II)
MQQAHKNIKYIDHRAASSYYHDEALVKLGAMIHEVLPVGMLACNCSVIGDERTREAIVIDPGDDVSEITAILDRHHLKVKLIAITHAHIDHIGGAAKLRALTGAPVYMHRDDSALAGGLAMQAEWLGMEAPENPGIDTAAQEGDVLRAGAIAAEVIHTPGHTPGSLSLFLPEQNKLFSGDTLFRGSIGRTDLPGGDKRVIEDSILSKLYKLPDNTVVIPGHGAATTIGREKATNPFVRG